MPIERDITDRLRDRVATAPTGTTSPDEKPNWAPDADPWIGQLIAEEWYQKYLEDERKQWGGDGDRPTAIPDAGPLRGSMGGTCARRVAYGVAGVERTDPPGISSAWNFLLGHIIHDNLQAGIDRAFPGSIKEVPVDLRPLGMAGSSNMDHGILVDERYLPTEIKSTGGFSFKLQATNFRGAPEGVKTEAVYQHCLSVAGIHFGGSKDIPDDALADHVKWVYVSKEHLSPSLAVSVGLGGEIDRFVAEWSMPTDQAIALGLKEAKRLEGIRRKTEEHGPEAVKRIVPYSHEVKGEIQDPTGASNGTRGTWVKTDPSGFVIETGTYWGCGYCPWQSQCSFDGVGR